jgi:Ni2+-binding GTPase involved in maturation of urease and hydrogenase
MFRSGVFGPSLCGKTTLVKAIAKEYQGKYRLRTIVLDPNLDRDWGQLATVTNDEKAFWQTIWGTKSCLVIVEESSETISRNKELIGVFTRLRHLQHKLIVVGHTGMSLLPVMRDQIDTLYLFLQSEKSAKKWCEDFCDQRLMEATRLNQYEFIRKEKFQPPRKMRLTISGKV